MPPNQPSSVGERSPAPVAGTPVAAEGAAAPVRVVICGAGPAGLLLAHHLLSFGNGKFQVVIYDKAEDPRETLKKSMNYRRFTIGISVRGANSVEIVPGLIEKVKHSSIIPDSFSMLLPFMKNPFVSQTRKMAPKGWLVDRFSLCASLMSALMEMYGDKIETKLLQVNFNCACTGVDLQDQVATFILENAGPNAQEIKDHYDLLVGADGLRSAVRSAFSQQIRNFEMEQKRLAGSWTVTHFPCPENFSKGTFHIFPTVPRSSGLTGLALPSPDGSLCFILGWSLKDNPAEWWACSTPKEAQEYIHSRLPYFNIPEDAAWQLRISPPQTSMQVKCWQYHDTKGHAVLVGDAAHATAPTLGSGCNASLVDASVLARMLLGEVVLEHNRAPDVSEFQGQRQMWAKDPSPDLIRAQLPSILERFSALQVKEGHSLVDMSDANGPLEEWAKILHSCMFLFRVFLHTFLPFLFSPPVMAKTGESTTPFSELNKQFKWETDLFLWSNSRYRNSWLTQQSNKALSKDL